MMITRLMMNNNGYVGKNEEKDKDDFENDE